MTTPTGPSKAEHDEGRVRQLLWRLRARLVTPPDELRARSDLDRLLATARDQAHDAPSRAASSRPGPLGVASTPSFPSSGHTGGDELAARRRLRLAPIGRVAAALVVVLASAAGFAGAVDGPVTLHTLLGRDADRAPQVAAPAPIEPEVTGEADGGTDPDTSDEDADADAAATETDGTDAPTGQDTEPRETPDVTPDDTGTDPDDGSADAADDAAEADTDDDAAETGADDGGTSGTGDTADDADHSGDAGETGDTGDVVEQVPDDAEIIAAPPSAGIDGSGGPAPCEAEDLADCVEDDTSDADADAVDPDTTEDTPGADGGNGSAGEGADREDGTTDATGGGSTDPDGTNDEAEADELANRRFQPDDDSTTDSSAD